MTFLNSKIQKCRITYRKLKNNYTNMKKYILINSKKSMRNNYKNLKNNQAKYFFKFKKNFQKS